MSRAGIRSPELPNVYAERRGRRAVVLALYASRVRSSVLLSGMPPSNSNHCARDCKYQAAQCSRDQPALMHEYVLRRTYRVLCREPQRHQAQQCCHQCPTPRMLIRPRAQDDEQSHSFQGRCENEERCASNRVWRCADPGPDDGNHCHERTDQHAVSDHAAQRSRSAAARSRRAACQDCG